MLPLALLAGILLLPALLYLRPLQAPAHPLFPALQFLLHGNFHGSLRVRALHLCFGFFLPLFLSLNTLFYRLPSLFQPFLPFLLWLHPLLA